MSTLLTVLLDHNCYLFEGSWLICIFVSGLLFHVCGEAVVNVNSNRTDRQTDKENYIDFRLRLLGEPGKGKTLLSYLNLE